MTASRISSNEVSSTTDVALTGDAAGSYTIKNTGTVIVYLNDKQYANSTPISISESFPLDAEQSITIQLDDGFGDTTVFARTNSGSSVLFFFRG